MKAVGICGSSRKEGNTEVLLKRCLQILEKEKIDVELISLYDKKIFPCKACGLCRKTLDKTCSIKEDDFHSIFSSMVEADIIIVGSPVYFGSATPQLMALLDRAGYVSRGNGNLFSKKIGGPLVVARRAGHNFTYAQILFWFMINDMVVPGSGYWNIAFGRAREDVMNDTEGITTIEHFADNLCWLAKKLYV